MILHNNGIVIQDKNFNAFEFKEHLNLEYKPSQEYLRYSGIARFVSWPLSLEKDQISKELSEEASKKWFDYFYNTDPQEYALEVVPDKDYCVRYIRHCNTKGVDIRILFCRTNREIPIWDLPVPESTFIGFDYASAQSFVSSIPEELLSGFSEQVKMKPEIQALDSCKDMLNANRLFSSENDILYYIEKRKTVIRAGIELELNSDGIIYEVSEVIGEL